eukprot:SAG22_NODE_1800_length_3543_cov_2.011614_1_plen_368_part_00
MPLCAAMFALSGLSATTWGRFQAIYLEEKSLTEVEIGIIAGITPIVQAVAIPMWGILADKLNSKKGVFLFTKAANTVSLCLLAIPTLACMQCFAPILGIIIAVFVLSSGGILDAWALDIMGPDGAKIWYGRVRMLCAMSWGLGALVMGIFVDLFDSFSPNFILYGVLGVACILIFAFKIPDKTASEAGRVESGEKQKFAELCKALTHPAALLFFVEVVIFGMATGAVEGLLFLFLKRYLMASTTLCGVSVAVSVVFEIPIFFYAGVILNWSGLEWVFTLAYFFLACRSLGLYDAPTRHGLVGPLPGSVARSLLRGLHGGCRRKGAPDCTERLGQHRAIVLVCSVLQRRGGTRWNHRRLHSRVKDAGG